MTDYKQLANVLRILAIDAVEAARSGHPGMPLGMADIATVLWHKFLRHNPLDPTWQNRDRFVLSNGHGSMLLYALLHMTGYELPLSELKNFRQLGSKTPGHPEYGVTPGVEATTGPLGQGLAMACGMALAERLLAEQFNRDNFNVVDHFTYCFVGDGCLMEGISHEVCSLAGTLGLGKLIVIFDNNKISIDGDVSKWCQDDVATRFAAYNWHVVADVAGHDCKQIEQALVVARKETSRPSIICCNTTIGFGSPKFAGSAKCHGVPLGVEEVAKVRETIAWQFAEAFFVPKELYSAWDKKEQGKKWQQEWESLFAEYSRQYPLLAEELQRRWQGQLLTKIEERVANLVAKFKQEKPMLATRQLSQQVLTGISQDVPELLGGSADLTESNGTWHQASHAITAKDFSGNYLHYGVREFAMSAIANGLALHGGFIPYIGTFLVFSDYARAAIRLASIQQQRVIYVLTHDSIALGEDGPTHQPVEHLAMLRITPQLQVWRPADAIETTVAWQEALQYQGPSCICLTRQKVSSLEVDANVNDIAKGAYALNTEADPDIILLATGSEVQLAIACAHDLAADLKIQVVSMPCVEKFLAQPESYRQKVLPQRPKKIAIEAGASAIWWQFVGSDGLILGLDRFGESAPGQQVYQHLGFNLDAIKDKVLKWCNF